MKDLSRFQPSRSTLLVDRLMTHMIKIGGIVVITAVMGIFVFILWQSLPVLPFFNHAVLKPVETVTLPATDASPVGIALDEWSERPTLLEANGALLISSKSGAAPEKWQPDGSLQNAEISYAAMLQSSGSFILGTADGQIAVGEIGFKPEFDADNNRTITAKPKLIGSWPTGFPGPVLHASYFDGGARKLAIARQLDGNGKSTLAAVILKQKRSLMGAGKTVVDRTDDLSGLFESAIVATAIGAAGEALIVCTADGDVYYLRIGDDKTKIIQKMRPFGGKKVQLAQFLLGGKTLVLCDADGSMVGYTLLIPSEDSGLQFVHTKTFEPLPGAPTAFAVSQRNRAFLIASGNYLSLRYGTTASTRWERELQFAVTHASLSSKFDAAALVGADGNLHFYSVDDPHPEAGWRGYFGKIWYEGASHPDYTWQSTGGSDDFEPKLSMVPLIFGSIKGTIFAMIFALPLALLAAIYCSQFLNHRYKVYVKPTMEIMASLPSVVLGFLGALWLAPLVEDKIPTVLAFLLIMPTFAMTFGFVWTRLPPNLRVICKPGREFLFALPIVLVSVALAMTAGPILERLLFSVAGHDGVPVADFRLWWNQTTGSNFEQRNALIVGFMMGFAVIPIIFTISEDALSNVPQSLRSASLALGASRWQTAIRIVLPTASPGIFSALMIGVGRAVGETMIVLMATGNTPIMEWSPFNGMRTLAANIAVELPEAPVGGTLFRSLYLGALLLFCMTFVLNTLAEFLRRHLRNKYKTV